MYARLIERFPVVCNIVIGVLQTPLHPFKLQHPLPVKYKGIRIDCVYRIAVFVDDTLIIELIIVDRLLPLHEAQLLTYMKLSGRKVGLLINFNQLRLRDGILRRALTRHQSKDF